MDFNTFLQSSVEKKIIDIETSKRLHTHFLELKSQENIKPSTAPKNSNSLLIVIGTIGVILFGIGVIYLFAHNWSNLSRSTKTILAFVPVLLSLAANLFTVTKRTNNVVWEESTAISTFLAVGSMLALLMQIYQLPGIENYFYFFWAALSIPVIYLLKSHVSVFMALVLILLNLTSYPMDQSSIFRLPWFGSLILFTTLLPYYRRLFLLQVPKTIYVLQQIALPIVVLTSFLVSLHDTEYSIWIISFLTMANFHLFGTSHLLRTKDRNPNILSIISYIGVSISLSFLLFLKHWKFDKLFTTDYPDHREIFIPLLFMLGLIQLFIYFRKEKISIANLHQWLILVPVPFILISLYYPVGALLYHYFVLGGIITFILVGQRLSNSFYLYPALSFFTLLLFSFLSFPNFTLSIFYFSLIPTIFYAGTFRFANRIEKSTLKVEQLLTIIGQLIILLIASFSSFWKMFDYNSFSHRYLKIGNPWEATFLILIAVAFIGFQMIRIAKENMTFFGGVPFFINLITPLLLIIGIYQLFPIHQIITLSLLTGSVILVITGAKRGSLMVTNLSLGLIGIVLLCRFFDVQMSLTIKGLVFIAIGLSFFLANYLIVKHKNASNEK